MSKSKPIRLFVYGTLRPGHAPASVAACVNRCRCLGEASTSGQLYDLRNYPGALVQTGTDQRIFGQLLELPDEESLARLDAYERFDPADPRGSLFVRTECDVTLDATGETVRAWVYVYNRDVSSARIIPTGRYDPNSAMRRPLIGITMDFRDDDTWRNGAYQLGADYARSIEAAGGLPFAIPYKVHPALVPQYVDLLDGVLFTGGNDLDPALYGEKWHPKAIKIDPLRQKFELALLAEVERRRTPVLGVCLGSQLMNVHRGGSLIQFLPDHPRDNALDHRKGDEPDGRRHPVKIEPGTVLAEAIGKTEIVVNTRHKQAVAKLGRGLRANAFAPDGIIEGIEDPSMPLYLAVQWHPENLSDAREHLAPFKLLVERAARKTEKKP